MWKRYEYNGGTADPCIISWPAGIKARGEIRDQYHHAVDIVPTILDVLGVDAPETIKGHVQSPVDGLSMRASFDEPSSPSPRKTQFYAMLGSRSIWHEGWKAVTTHPVLSGWGHFNDDEWELYHTDIDRTETHNLAAEHPDKVRELVNLWFAEAGANGVFPLDDRSVIEIANTPHVNNFVGTEQMVVGAEDISTGQNLILSASFDKTSLQADHAAGTLTLYHGDRKVGQAEIKTQLGAYAIAGAGLYVGRHPGEPVTDDYPGSPPYTFTGIIDRVAIDISGEAYADLEREAQLMIMRD
jgi:Sulfatase